MSNSTPAVAMILAAGRGQRMRPLTDDRPKPMLSVGGQPLIFYHLHKLARANVQRVVINHAWHGKVMRDAIGDGRDFGLEVIWSGEPPGGLETAGGIIRALPHLGGNEFIVVNGDVWSNFDYVQLPALAPDQLGHLVLVPNPEHHPNGDFMLSDGQVGTASNESQSFTFAGISVLHSQLFDGYIDGFMKLRPFFERAIDAGRLTGELFEGSWCDVGTPTRLAQLDGQLRAQQKVGP